MDVPNLVRMAEKGSPVVVANSDRTPDWIKLEGLERLHSYVGAPVRVMGQTVGFINLHSATRMMELNASLDVSRLEGGRRPVERQVTDLNRLIGDAIQAQAALAACKLAVEVHGERIWAESAPGRGATFNFALPIASPPRGE
jgi:signal transduction histidine kinase